MMQKKEDESTINSWSVSDTKYLFNSTIHELFEKQVDKNPDGIAVVYEDKQLTYQELNNRANHLAKYLKEIQSCNICPDNLIVLCLDRSEYILIAILAVLKAGGAYVPIDPSYPDERIRYILNDTKTNLVLTNEVYAKRLNKIASSNNIIIDLNSNKNKRNNQSDLTIHNTIQYSSKFLVIAVDEAEFLKRLYSLKLETSNIISSVRSRNLAYVIYTSGTTGKPKGVMIEHKGVINTIKALTSVYNFNQGFKVAFFTSYVFDVSVSEMFISLLRGAVLHIFSDIVRMDAVLISGKFLLSLDQLY